MEYRNNPEYWKMGFIYYNPKDPLLVVPKLNGLGWTVNFGNKLLYKYLGALLAIMAIYIFIKLSWH